MDATTEPAARYDAVMQAIHWATLVLIAAVFAAAWTAHSGLAGEWSRPVMQLHRSLGLAVLALTAGRLAWRSGARIPPLPSALPRWQKLAARGTEGLLYALLILQPLLGLLQTSARGQPVDLFFLFRLPPAIGPDRALARQLHDAHALCAEALLVLIGLHAAAALSHHFIRRDRVLVAMLPQRARRSTR